MTAAVVVATAYREASITLVILDYVPYKVVPLAGLVAAKIATECLSTSSATRHDNCSGTTIRYGKKMYLSSQGRSIFIGPF